MVHAGARVSKMAKYCFWVTTPTRSATSLHGRDPSEEDAGYLAPVAYRRAGVGLKARKFGRGQHPCGPRARRSHI